jgi:hypothetical protein
MMIDHNVWVDCMVRSRVESSGSPFFFLLLNGGGLMLMLFLLFCPAFLVCAAHATDGFASLSSSGLVFFFFSPF